VEKVLVETMISEPEVVRREKKTVDDRVIQIERMIQNSNSKHNESITDVKLEISHLKAEMMKSIAEIKKMLK
jgi:hypothetical protein